MGRLDKDIGRATRAATLSDQHSKDYQMGFALGCGEPLPYDATEGTRGLAAVARLAELLDVDAPICTLIGATVRGDISVAVAADRLASWDTDLE